MGLLSGAKELMIDYVSLTFDLGFASWSRSQFCHVDGILHALDDGESHLCMALALTGELHKFITCLIV